MGEIPRVLHFIGIVFWLGGIVAVALAGAAAAASSDKATFGALRGASLKVGVPGMVLAWIGGLGMLMPHFATLYAHAPWMHAKLALVVVASALSGVLGGKLRKAAGDGPMPSAKALGGMASALALVAVVVVSLAVLKPGS